MPLRKRVSNRVKSLSTPELETKWPHSLSPTSQQLTYDTNPNITKQKLHQPTKSNSPPSSTSLSLIFPFTQLGNARKPQIQKDSDWIDEQVQRLDDLVAAIDLEIIKVHQNQIEVDEEYKRVCEEHKKIMEDIEVMKDIEGIADALDGSIERIMMGIANEEGEDN